MTNMKTTDPMVAVRAALTGDTLDIKALDKARHRLDLGNRKQARSHLVLGNLVSVIQSARAVCGVKDEA